MINDQWTQPKPTPEIDAQVAVAVLVAMSPDAERVWVNL